MLFPRFLFSSVLLHVTLIGALISFAGMVPRQPFLSTPKPVLEVSLWAQPKVGVRLGRPDEGDINNRRVRLRTEVSAKHLASDATILAKNMQESQLKGFSSGVRRRVLGQGKVRIEDALYLDSWKRKVEAVGNLNYPGQARKLGISGSLRLRVLLNQDGNIVEVTLLSSSGENILDEAALHIVHLAAPFAPFPPSMRKETDVLEIVRTWQFLGSREVVM